MPTVDFSHLSTQERLDLIGETWDSLDADELDAALDRRHVPIPAPLAAQAA